MGERVAYREMFLTGHPPESTSVAGAEVAALTAEMEQIIQAAQNQNALAAAAGQGGSR